MVPSPTGEPALSELNAVTAISPSDIWAVGDNDQAGVGTLILHWNGTAWSIVPGATLPTTHSFLTGVSGTSSR